MHTNFTTITLHAFTLTNQPCIILANNALAIRTVVEFVIPDVRIRR